MYPHVYSHINSDIWFDMWSSKSNVTEHTMWQIFGHDQRLCFNNTYVYYLFSPLYIYIFRCGIWHLKFTTSEIHHFPLQLGHCRQGAFLKIHTHTFMHIYIHGIKLYMFFWVMKIIYKHIIYILGRWTYFTHLKKWLFEGRSEVTVFNWLYVNDCMSLYKKIKTMWAARAVVFVGLSTTLTI